MHVKPLADPIITRSMIYEKEFSESSKTCEANI